MQTRCRYLQRSEGVVIRCLNRSTCSCVPSSSSRPSLTVPFSVMLAASREHQQALQSGHTGPWPFNLAKQSAVQLLRCVDEMQLLFCFKQISSEPKSTAPNFAFRSFTWARGILSQLRQVQLSVKQHLFQVWLGSRFLSLQACGIKVLENCHDLAMGCEGTLPGN